MRLKLQRQSSTKMDVKGLTTIFCVLCAITLAPPVPPAGAESARSLVDKGNELLAAGSLDEALKAYEEAGQLMPEAGEILFNKGNAYFRKGDYEKAREAFEGAALRTKDLSLEARSQFNLGNTAFAQAGELLKEDLQKGLDRYGLSIRHYQNALRIDPGLVEAAENIEIARLQVKDLLDQIKNQEDQEKERQKQQEELKKQLEEVIREQESEIASNDSLKEQMARAPDESFRERLDKLASDQGRTRHKTRDIARRIDPVGQQGQSGGPEDASEAVDETASQSMESSPESSEGEDTTQGLAKHVQNALGAQESALDEIDKSELDGAKGHQEEALQELRQALASLDESKEDRSGTCQRKDDGKQGEREKPEKQGEAKAEEQAKEQSARQQQNDQEGKEAQESRKPEEEQEKPGKRGEQAEESEQSESASREARQAQPQGREDSSGLSSKSTRPGGEGEDQKAAAVMREKPEDILKEERENRLQFEHSRKGSYNPVGKDW